MWSRGKKQKNKLQSHSTNIPLLFPPSCKGKRPIQPGSAEADAVCGPQDPGETWTHRHCHIITKQKCGESFLLLRKLNVTLNLRGKTLIRYLNLWQQASKLRKCLSYRCLGYVLLGDSFSAVSHYCSVPPDSASLLLQGQNEITHR